MKSKLFYHPILVFTMLLMLGALSGQCTNPGYEKASVDNLISEKSDSEPLKVEPYIDTLEVFIDSTSFGQKGKTKIELRRIGTEDDVTVHVSMFFLKNGIWILSDNLVTHGTPISSVRPVFNDFNRDGFNDILFFSSEGGRGANSIQTLVIFDPAKNKMIWVKNSESYPNIRYNSKHRCLDSWRVTGSESTHFLRLNGDSLIEFAAVHHSEGRVRAERINSGGERKEIKNVSEKEFGCDFCRFSNYDPIEVE